jgi:hypothetical protein
MANNTTSVTITFRLVNDDLNGSIAAIKALLQELAKSLTTQPVEALEK